MALEVYKVDPNYKKERQFVCPHNDGVMCSFKNCYYCGWHPTTAKIRLKKVIEQLGGDGK